MATILNIETSTRVCSVALTSDGYILSHREDFDGPNHASVISSFIKDCLDYLHEHDDMRLDAVAVSLGPGSYTGLRIGLSEAKGLVYGLKVPLIGIPTLKILAVEAMFALEDFSPDTDVLIPMIDARRSEVYTATFNGCLEEIDTTRAEILNEESYENKYEAKRLIFIGNGASKAMEILMKGSRNMIFMPELNPIATDMCALSEMAFSRQEFLDLAYSVPFYLKEFMATKPNKRI